MKLSETIIQTTKRATEKWDTAAGVQTNMENISIWVIGKEKNLF